jgi:membrane-associated HD superfamily phosphohydrolase
MLADAAESSSRALSDPTPRSLRKLVHDLLMKRLLDGQFEESELTLTELSIGDNFRVAIAVVRCPRSELPPKEDLLAKAERFL